MARQQGCGNAVLGRSRRMDTLDGRTRLVELRETAGKGRHEANARRDLVLRAPLGVEGEARGCDRGPESSASRGALEAALEMGSID